MSAKKKKHQVRKGIEKCLELKVLEGWPQEVSI
jgi:hypothetical protein